MLVTAGDDNWIKFWDPMGLSCLAIITENEPIKNVISFAREFVIYYHLKTKVVSFNYVRPKFETVFESSKDSEIKTMIGSSDTQQDLIIGDSSGCIHFINWQNKQCTSKKNYHDGNSIVAMTHSNEMLISADVNKKIVFFNIETNQPTYEFNAS